MNKRGVSDVFMAIIQILLVGLVITFMIARANSIDVEVIKRTFNVNNVGLIMSAISFLPGNFYYVYLTEDDGKMANWNKFPAQFELSTINYGETSLDYKYDFFSMNIPPDIPSAQYEVTKNSIKLQKTDMMYMDKLTNLKKLPCSPVNVNLPVRPDKGGDSNKFYDKNGNEIQNPEIDYVDMEKQYFVDNERVHKGDRGITSPNYQEAKITYEIAKVADPSVKDVFIARENLDKHILLTIGNYDSTYSYIIAYVPIDDYEENYNIACTILNRIIDHPEFESAVQAIAVVPTREKHIILEIGNINNPVLFEDEKLKLIGESI